MGKKGKPAQHKRSLGVELLDPATQGVRAVPRPKKRARMDKEEEEEGGGVVTQEMSNTILKEARAQREEVEAEMRGGGAEQMGSASGLVSGALKAALQT